MDKVRTILRLLGKYAVTAVVLATVGCSGSIYKSSCAENALETSVISEAEHAQITQSALEALQRGDTAEAVHELESQLKTSLLVLHSEGPRLKSNGGLTNQQQQIIDQVIADGDKYVGDRKK